MKTRSLAANEAVVVESKEVFVPVIQPRDRVQFAAGVYPNVCGAGTAGQVQPEDIPVVAGVDTPSDR